MPWPHPPSASLFVQRVVVGVGDLAVSNSQVVLSTYALGSCVAVIAYDPGPARRRAAAHHAAGLADLRGKAAAQPAMFADTGLAQFFRELTTFKASAVRLQIFLAGGASVISGTDPFRIGERNAQAVIAGLDRARLAPAAAPSSAAASTAPCTSTSSPAA